MAISIKAAAIWMTVLVVLLLVNASVPLANLSQVGSRVAVSQVLLYLPRESEAPGPPASPLPGQSQ